MEPAQTIIAALGGPTKVAHAAGVHRTRVSNWSRPKEKGGCDGKIPSKHIDALISYGAEIGVLLTHSSFFRSSVTRSEDAA